MCALMNRKCVNEYSSTFSADVLLLPRINHINYNLIIIYVDGFCSFNHHANVTKSTLIHILYSIVQDLKLMDKLLNKHGESLEDKSLTICSGTDYINVNYQHVVLPDAATAKVSHHFPVVYIHRIAHRKAPTRIQYNGSQ